MTRRILVTSLAALTLAAAAPAKGPVPGSVSGPGLDRPVPITVQATGFFAAVYGQSPGAMLAERPTGDLGPRFTISVRLRGWEGEHTIRQDVYPYAEAGPITYIKPGQPFFGMDETRGGWYRGSRRLEQALVAAGLPQRPPRGGVSPSRPWALVTGIAVALIAGTGLVAVRHRLIGRLAR